MPVLRKPAAVLLNDSGHELIDLPAETSRSHADYHRVHTRWPKWLKERVHVVLHAQGPRVFLKYNLPEVSASWSHNHKAKACMAMEYRLGPDWHQQINGERWLQTEDRLWGHHIVGDHPLP